MNLMDVFDGPRDDKNKNQTYYEHSQVFEDLVNTTDKEYVAQLRPPRLHRNSSVPRVNASTGKSIAKAVRRHSSFEPRDRLKTYKDHKAMKEYLGTPRGSTHKRRTHKFDVIQKMLEFNLSASVTSFNDLSMMNKSLGLHYSCPVLSYMNEDEEDSVELTYLKKRQSRRSSLCSLTEDESESWESLNDLPTDGSMDASSQDYQISMKLVDEDNRKPRAKRQRSRTCLMLSHELANGQHPQKILRLFKNQCS
jgi:hypothetical protein